MTRSAILAFAKLSYKHTLHLFKWNLKVLLNQAQHLQILTPKKPKIYKICVSFSQLECIWLFWKHLAIHVSTIIFMSPLYYKHCKTSAKVSYSKDHFHILIWQKLLSKSWCFTKSIFHFFSVELYWQLEMGNSCNLLVSISYFSSVQ